MKRFNAPLIIHLISALAQNRSTEMAHPEQLRVRANALIDRAAKLRQHADSDLLAAEKAEAEAQDLETDASRIDAERNWPDDYEDGGTEEAQGIISSGEAAEQ